MNYSIINCEQGTEEWLKARSGCVTGTRLKSVMSTRGDTRKNLIYEMIAEKIAPLPENYQSSAMERGHIIESVVKELYEEHGEVIEEVGFVKKYEWLGVSPDGLIKNPEGIYTRAIEIKGPEAKNLVRYWIEGGIPAEYYWQVIQYFIVIDTLESLDFIISNPDIIDAKYRTKVTTVTREELSQDIQKAQEALTNFYSEYRSTIHTFLSNSNHANT